MGCLRKIGPFMAENPGMASAAHRAKSGAISIALGYALFAGLWILLSDRVMGLWITDPDALVRASMLKGWFFVAVTTLLLYSLVRRLAASLVEAQQRELDMAQERKQPPPMLVAIADASDDAIFAKDEEGRYLFLNAAAARILGTDVEQALGRNNRSLLPLEPADAVEAIEERVRETGQTESAEQTVQTAYGERRFLTTRGPMRGHDGKVFGTYGIARDITAAKQAESDLRLLADDLSATLQAIPDLMFEFDAEGHYIKAKALNEALLAAPQQQLAGRTAREVLPAEAADTVMQALAAAARSGTDFGRTIVLPLASGDRHFELSVARKPVAEGQPERFIVLSRDITERQRVEAELRQRNQELERFNRAATERELRMVALKREVNAWARDAGQAEPYDTSFADAPRSSAAP
jgi:PAS domain S-box-containing protein